MSIRFPPSSEAFFSPEPQSSLHRKHGIGNLFQKIFIIFTKYWLTVLLLLDITFMLKYVDWFLPLLLMPSPCKEA